MARKTKEMNPRQVDTLPDGFWAAGNRLYLQGLGRWPSPVWVCRFVRAARSPAWALAGPGRAGLARQARDKAKKFNETSKAASTRSWRGARSRQAEDARKTLRQATEAYIEEKNPEWGASSRAIWRRSWTGTSK